MPPTNIVFIHGWSAHHTNTYGALPERLAAEVPGVSVRHLHLGKYISFHDEVRVRDVADALDAAVQKELAGEQFAVIAHSTGGPVIRTWWQQRFADGTRPCPLTHAIFLAAAQFGSALAVLGKGRLGKVKSMLDAIEPGQGVLDWLCLGSRDAWVLNEKWIRLNHARGPGGTHGMPWCFSLVGQQIDRKLYDVLNSYTSELGSDGTVRCAAANLNAGYVKLVQQNPTAAQLRDGAPSAFRVAEKVHTQDMPFAIVPGASHVGTDKGIMRSVRKTGRAPVVGLIRKCLAVANVGDFGKLTDEFRVHTDAVQEKERVELDKRVGRDRVYIHDRSTMAIVRIHDDHGYALNDFRVTFLGERSDPRGLPRGFHIDRQRNGDAANTVTFFLNYDVLHGCPAAYLERRNRKRKKVRDTIPPMSGLGILIEASPDEGFAHYHPCILKSTPEMLKNVLRPNETTLIDVVLKRVVHKGTFSFADGLKRKDFRKQNPGPRL